MALKFANNNSLSAITSVPSGVGGGSLNLISTQTASSSSTISFTSGIDSTYKEYIFKFIDIHPGTENSTMLQFQGSTNGGSSYGINITSTSFRALHTEADDSTSLAYSSSTDLAQSTNYQYLTGNMGTDNDQADVGTLHLFDPSSTTFVKHFIANFNNCGESNISLNTFNAGYFNTTSAINAIQFKMSTGNIDAGTIKLYGVS